MKLCRFLFDSAVHWGAVELRDRTPWVERIVPPPPEDTVARSSSARFEPRPVEQLHLLAPVTPSKIICVGRNYREHAAELGNAVPREPLLFFKPPSSLLAPGAAIQMPAVSQRVDYEGELGVVLGKRVKDLDAAAAVAPLLRGFTCVNDVTARDLQKTDGQWTRAKGFDTFCPVGPWLATPDEVDLDRGAALVTRLNGQVRQRGNTRDLIFDISFLVRYISRIFTLEPGDLIATGTPAGVGPMQAGDTVEVEIEGIGILRNQVAGRSQTAV